MAKSTCGTPFKCNFQKRIQQYLGEKKLPFNILKDEEFSRSREVLLAKTKKKLLKQGKGNKFNATRELTDEDEEKLFKLDELREQDPLTL